MFWHFYQNSGEFSLKICWPCIHHKPGNPSVCVVLKACLWAVLHFWIKKSFTKKPFTLQSGNFHEVLPDILVFLKFYSNVLTEIKYSDNAIEFYTENYILSQIFTNGIKKSYTNLPHPRVAIEHPPSGQYFSHC